MSKDGQRSVLDSPHLVDETLFFVDRTFRAIAGRIPPTAIATKASFVGVKEERTMPMAQAALGAVMLMMPFIMFLVLPDTTAVSCR